MSWNHNQTSILIDLYRNHEVLYIVKDPQYHNKGARLHALETITKGLSEIRPNTTVNDVKVKINSLRTQFNKELGKLKSKPSGSGAELVQVGLWCFEQLLFLQDHVNARTSFSNLSRAAGCSTWDEVVEITDSQGEHTLYESESMSNGSSENADLDETITETPRTKRASNQPINKNNKKRMIDDAAIPLFQEITTALNKISEPVVPNNTWQTFATFLADEIQTIKSNRIKQACKRHIINVLHKYQQQDEEEN
ncbi:uncharacterized protein LOC116165293 [Photinus pyralis]|uniref:uncharacterized protein LOC116165293 n=1 Tax=Photinus pyralis TaxID=7054 RepID=UPI0012675359|nr:uncharacterized protein LOC116165293 [Photinus pyralis]